MGDVDLDKWYRKFDPDWRILIGQPTKYKYLKELPVFVASGGNFAVELQKEINFYLHIMYRL